MLSSSSLIIESVIAAGEKIDGSKKETRDLMAAGASTSRGVGVEEQPNNRTEIVFFDVETSIPSARGQGHELLEFGAILVCPRKLEELDSYSTLIRPYDLSCVSAASVRCNGITRDAVSTAPTFLDVADRVYDILHGRVWAGHNIARFDCPRIREAFARINRSPPEPKGIIDSLALLTQRFGKRAGNMKMATLASYFGLGQQTHRSLDDVRMNLEVVKYCATVLFLESSLPDIPTVKKIPIPVGNTITRSHANTASSSSQDASSSALPGDDAKGRALTTNAEPTELPARPSSAQLASIDPFDLSRFVDELKPDSMQLDATPTYKGPREVEPEALTQGPAEGCSSSPDFLKPNEISLTSVSASLGASHWGHQRINLLHKGSLLQIRCSKSNVRFGVSSKFLDHAGRPRLSVVVDASPVLCAVLDKCDQLAQQLFDDNAGSSEWRAVITRKNGFSNFPPTIRLHIPTVSNGEATVYATELYQRQPNGALQTLTFADVTMSDLEALLSPGALVDADFCLDFYDYLQHSGIRLVARRLFVHPKSATKEYASPT